MSDLGWVRIAEFSVYGLPKAQPRPRFSRLSGRVYNPPTAKAWKASIQEKAEAALLPPFSKAEPFDGPVKVDIQFWFRRPKRLQTKASPDGPIPYIQKPDRDNLDKAVLDALGAAGWFKDDAQACDGRIRKYFVPKGGGDGSAIITISMLASDGED